MRISERATYRQNLPVDAEERRKHALLEDTSVSTPLQAEPLAMLLEVKGVIGPTERRKHALLQERRPGRLRPLSSHPGMHASDCRHVRGRAKTKKAGRSECSFARSRGRSPGLAVLQRAHITPYVTLPFFLGRIRPRPQSSRGCCFTTRR